MITKTVLHSITVAAEVTGTTLSANAIAFMASELSAYPEEQVLKAIKACARESKFKITLASIIEKLDSTDGRPSADEAWAIAIKGQDERESVVWNDEIASAMGIARCVLESGDEVGARMAFRSAYGRIVATAREAGTPSPRWWVSQGSDADRRVIAIKEAESKGLLTNEAAKALLPPANGLVSHLLLGGPVPDAVPENRDEIVAKCKELLDMLRRKDA